MFAMEIFIVIWVGLVTLLVIDEASNGRSRDNKIEKLEEYIHDLEEKVKWQETKWRH